MDRELVADRVARAMAAAIPLVAATAPNGLAVILVAAGVVLAVCDHNARRLVGVSRLLLKLVVALLGWAAITLLWAPSAAEGADGIVRMVAATYFGLVILSRIQRTSSAVRSDAMRWFLWSYALALALLAVQMVSNALLGPENSLYVAFYGYEARNEAFYNRAKTVLTILLPIATYVSALRYGWAGGVTIVAVCTAVAVFGESMASAVSLLAIAVGLAVGYWLRDERLRRACAAILVIFMIVTPILANSNVLARLSQRTDVTVSIFHRAGIWGFVSQHIFERPISGWGMHASRMMPDGHEKFRAGAEWLPLHPHNAPLQIWLELGAVGAVIGSCLVATIFLACRGTRWRAGITMSTFAATFFVANVSYGIWQGWWFSTLWLIAIIAIAVFVDDRRPEKDRSDVGPYASKPVFTT